MTMYAKYYHFPETVGKGRHICGDCRHSEPRVEYIGIGTVRRVKGCHDCMLEPNQRRVVSHVIECIEFSPRPHTIRQMKLDKWGVTA